MTRKRFDTLDDPGTPDETELTVLNAYVIRPDEVKPNDVFGYKIVCWVFEFYPGWCCYKGPMHWSDAQVKAFGDELPQGVAEALFPTIAASPIARVYGNV